MEYPSKHREIHHNGMEFVPLGDINGPVTPRLKAVVKVWHNRGFTTNTFDAVVTAHVHAKERHLGLR